MEAGVPDPGNAQLQLQDPILRAMTKKLSLLSVAMVLTGCVETIVMDPHAKDLPVVVNCVLQTNLSSGWVYGPLPHYNGLSTTSRKQFLTLQYAKGKSALEYVAIVEAEVYVTCESDNSVVREDTLRFFHSDGCNWECEGRIKPDKEYTLHVEIPGRDPIWAETKSSPNIDLIRDYDEVPENSFTSEELREFINEQARRPFLIKTGDGVSLEDCSLYVFPYQRTRDGWSDIRYIVTDHPGADDFNIAGGRFSDLSILGNPEAPYDNNDYTAEYIIGKSYEIDHEIMADLPLHDGFLRIVDLEEGRRFNMTAGPIWYPNRSANDHYSELRRAYEHLVYVIHLVNDDLDEYLQSVMRYTSKLDHYLTSVYGTDPEIYSNIHGGSGIFGSCNSSWTEMVRDYIANPLLSVP